MRRGRQAERGIASVSRSTFKICASVSHSISRAVRAKSARLQPGDQPQDAAGMRFLEAGDARLSGYGLVHEEDWSVLKQGARNAHALPLPSGEDAPADANRGVHEEVDAGLGSSFVHLMGISQARAWGLLGLLLARSLQATPGMVWRG